MFGFGFLHSGVGGLVVFLVECRFAQHLEPELVVFCFFCFVYGARALLGKARCVNYTGGALNTLIWDRSGCRWESMRERAGSWISGVLVYSASSSYIPRKSRHAMGLVRIGC